MTVKLLGVKRIHFTNNNGEEINGTNLYCAFQDENVEGYCTEKFFLKEGITLPKDTKQNNNVELEFNMNGKVDRVLKAN